MLVDKPEKPQGRHVLLLRTHLALTQTEFGALLGINQPGVSTLESPHKKDAFLAPELIDRFLQIWDCFPIRPPGGFDELINLLAAYRKGNTVHLKAPGTDDRQPSGPEQTWEIYFAREPLPPGARLFETVPVGTTAPLTRTFAAVEGVSSVPPEGPRTRRSSSSRGRLKLATAAALTVLLFPTGCFQTHRDVRPGEVARTLSAQSPDPHPTAQPHLESELSHQQVPQMWGKIASSQPLAVEPQKPLEPFKGQKQAPCAPTNGELELDKLCWWELSATRPCPTEAPKRDGKCLLPVPEHRRSSAHP